MAHFPVPHGTVLVTPLGAAKERLTSKVSSNYYIAICQANQQIEESDSSVVVFSLSLL